MPSILNVSIAESQPHIIVADRGSEIEVWCNVPEMNYIADRIVTLWPMTEGKETLERVVGYTHGSTSTLKAKRENVSDRSLAELVNGWYKGESDQAYADGLSNRPKRRYTSIFDKK
jgi:hypothetical protein